MIYFENKDDKRIISFGSEDYLNAVYSKFYENVIKNEENNTSEATIIISLTTGKASDYLWIAFIAIVIIAMGVIGVMRINKNKKV